MSDTSSAAAGAMRVAITGSTGLIGSALADRLARDGHTVVRIVRGGGNVRPGDVVWDPEAETIDAAALEGVDAIVHLAGENVGSRWTEEKKRRIMESRIKGTRLIARTAAHMTRQPRVLVQAAATGIYGDRGDEVLDETSATGKGFLADVGRAWEGASSMAEDAGIRVVKLRFGIVLSARGGALKQLLLPFRMGVGGPVGDGRQWMPWLAIDDAVEMIVTALRDSRYRGAINAITDSTRNADFTHALGRAVHRPTLIPTPAFALRALFGEMADEALLGSQHAQPRRLKELGFRYHHPTLDDALHAALRDR